MPKLNIMHDGVQIATVSVDVCVSENMSVQEATQLMAGGYVSLEVNEADKLPFINGTHFACVVLQLLQSEKIRCVPRST